MARLVNKQFNSPIGLYSQQNIQDVIDRESQMLSNGAVGIDFNNPNVGKPSNLKNSAVLRMLEEEERHGSRTGNNQILNPLRVWPPPDYEKSHQQRSSFKDVVTPGVKRVAWPPPHETDTNSPHLDQSTEGGPRYPPLQASNYQQPKSNAPLKLDVSISQSSVPSAISPSSNQSPLGYKAPVANRGWAPVQSPVNAPKQSPWNQNDSKKWQTQYQPTQQQYIENVQEFSTNYGQQVSKQDQYQNLYNQYQSTEINSAQQRQYFSNPTQYPSPQREPSLQSSYGQGGPVQTNPPASKFVEPPPTSITLRSQVPVNQVPSPIFTSQPATTTLKVKVNPKNLRGDLKWPPEDVKQKIYEETENINSSNSFLSIQGGKHLRGDLKWPPESVKLQAEEENRLRLELAKGPVCRPRKVKRDYTSFFQQHALNFSYPGYKVPPGTQFYRAE
ncbi:uncharacterized protein LOC130449459 isoform X1 [Diorhabda sublineata]|uniref:uncharacterized protein LOC130449459 isoform X1 n=1 Tax=Diorhabda sublineata TaxID=1163346 RepID=UPI0024E0AD5B|nr:uncharacterized protein LOC130449459 isoform X1 [Diorhabda sublineata]